MQGKTRPSPAPLQLYTPNKLCAKLHARFRDPLPSSPTFINRPTSPSYQDLCSPVLINNHALAFPGGSRVDGSERENLRRVTLCRSDPPWVMCSSIPSKISRQLKVFLCASYGKRLTVSFLSSKHENGCPVTGPRLGPPWIYAPSMTRGCSYRCFTLDHTASNKVSSIESLIIFPQL